MSQGNDQDLRAYLLAQGVVPESTVEDCLLAQETMAGVGVSKTLAEVLVEKGVLSRREVRRIVAKMRGGDEDFVPGYRIVKKLGDGAMGRVYKAVQLSCDREVALKVLYPRFAREERFVKMFQREAKASLDLDHKNLVRGYVGRVSIS